MSLYIMTFLVATAAGESFLPGYTATYNISRQLGGAPDQFRPPVDVDVDCAHMAEFCATVSNSSLLLDTRALNACRCVCHRHVPILNQYLRKCDSVFGEPFLLCITN